ncbi:hypothetical protein L9F63_002868, partial [Diploptera punctata]
VSLLLTFISLLSVVSFVPLWCRVLEVGDNLIDFFFLLVDGLLSWRWLISALFLVIFMSCRVFISSLFQLICSIFSVPCRGVYYINFVSLPGVVWCRIIKRSCLHYGYGDFSFPHVTLWTGPYPENLILYGDILLRSLMCLCSCNVPLGYYSVQSCYCVHCIVSVLMTCSLGVDFCSLPGVLNSSLSSSGDVSLVWVSCRNDDFYFFSLPVDLLYLLDDDIQLISSRFSVPLGCHVLISSLSALISYLSPVSLECLDFFSSSLFSSLISVSCRNFICSIFLVTCRVLTSSLLSVSCRVASCRILPYRVVS